MSNETPKANTKKIASALKASALVILFLFALILVRQKSPLQVKIKAPSGKLSAEIANTEQARELGLSGRGDISPHQAMLFVFDSDSSYGFWMKDMKFPIDIIWLDADKKVVTILANAQPDSYPKTFLPDKPSRYVIETASNRAAQLGIKVGAQLEW